MCDVLCRAAVQALTDAKHAIAQAVKLLRDTRHQYGLCIACEQPSDGHTRCPACRAKGKTKSEHKPQRVHTD